MFAKFTHQICLDWEASKSWKEYVSPIFRMFQNCSSPCFAWKTSSQLPPRKNTLRSSKESRTSIFKASDLWWWGWDAVMWFQFLVEKCLEKTGCKITLANIWIQVDMVIRIFVAFGTPSQKKSNLFWDFAFGWDFWASNRPHKVYGELRNTSDISCNLLCSCSAFPTWVKSKNWVGDGPWWFGY